MFNVIEVMNPGSVAGRRGENAGRERNGAARQIFRRTTVLLFAVASKKKFPPDLVALEKPWRRSHFKQV